VRGINCLYRRAAGWNNRSVRLDNCFWGGMDAGNAITSRFHPFPFALLLGILVIFPFQIGILLKAGQDFTAQHNKKVNIIISKPC
jgi:hypothetical protein